MKRMIWVVLLALALAGRAAEPEQFQELYDLLKANLPGITEAGLDGAAVTGLVKQLSPRVSFVGEQAVDTNGAPMLTSAVLDRHYGYVRVSRVAAGLDKEFTNTIQRLFSTNKIKGLVLDLRFASGQDYAAAVGVADQFFPEERKLIDWGEDWKSSTSKPEAIVTPVALLVNRQTSGAAEALAGMLRLSDVGLLIGTNTAGQASKFKEFALKDGRRVRIAIAPVKVAKEKELPGSGLKPDIQVDVSPDDEAAWFQDAYKLLPKAGRLASATNSMNLQVTNRPTRRLNEAELVRLRREGLLSDAEPTNAPTRRNDSTPPIIHDPALARAVDLLKGLAVVQQFRSI